MRTLVNTPRAHLNGINDGTILPRVTPSEDLPTFLPLLFTFAERGGTQMEIYNKVSAQSALGTKTFDYRGKFFTHQDIFINGLFEAGNLVGIQRLIPADALPPAGFILWADVLTDDIVQYEIDPVTKKFVLDVNGNKIPTDPATTLPGVSIKFSVTELHRVNAAGERITPAMISAYNGGDTSVDIVAVANTLGSDPSMQGPRTNGGGGNSTMYKIGEFALSEQGSFGNRAGLRLFPVTETSANAPNSDYASSVGSFLYRMQVLYAESALANTKVVPTVYSSQYSQFSFDDQAIDPVTDAELHHSVKLIDEYDPKTLEPASVESPLFSEIFIHEDNIAAICNMIGQAEAASNPDFDFDPEEDTHTINFMTGETFEEIPYITFELVGSSEGGVLLTPFNTMMALGGSDGTTDADTFDKLVAEQANNFGDLENKYKDMARYPVSVIIDSGFSMDTKTALGRIPALRKDFVGGFTNWVYGQGILTEDQNIQSSIALSNALRGYAESDVFNTGATRYFITGQQGHLIGNTYKGVVPTLYNVICEAFAPYMGSGNKVWRSNKAPDDGDNKDIVGMTKVNHTSLDEKVEDLYFSLGVLMAKFKDRKTLFFPTRNGIYKEQSSVLTSIITVFGMADAEKVAHKAWTRLVGNGKLTEEQYIERLERDMMEDFRKRNFYDNRFVIQVVPYYTPEDRLNGKSITIDINMYANRTKDVFKFTINALDQASLS